VLRRFALSLLAVVAAGCNIVLGLDGLVADRDPGAAGGGGAGGAGSSATSGSTGSSGSCMGVCGTPGCGACPIVETVVVTAPAGTFSIDKYEVDNASYNLFLAAGPSFGLAPPECADNTSYEPGVITPLGYTSTELTDAQTICDAWNRFDREDERPVGCVDWCDAYAFCAWAGKRLCGDIAGGDYVVDAPGPHADAAVSEWFAACTGPSATAFPYGATYDDTVCSDDNGGPEPVGAYPQCEGGYPGIFDMSGNMAEWENACSDYNNPDWDQNCLLRGGTWYQTGAEAQCDAYRDVPRYNMADSIGFRCCSSG
jgi:formylglycine-generating enzyme required for sulfatase activity